MANPSGAKSPRWYYATSDDPPRRRKRKRGLFSLKPKKATKRRQR